MNVDMVNSPPHYNSHPSGVEVIEITRHLNFNIGNAVKYILRHEKKGSPLQDIDKAIWYIRDSLHNSDVFEWPTRAAVTLVKYINYDPDMDPRLVSALWHLVSGELTAALERLAEYRPDLAEREKERRTDEILS